MGKLSNLFLGGGIEYSCMAPWICHCWDGVGIMNTILHQQQQRGWWQAEQQREWRQQEHRQSEMNCTPDVGCCRHAIDSRNIWTAALLRGTRTVSHQWGVQTMTSEHRLFHSHGSWAHLKKVEYYNFNAYRTHWLWYMSLQTLHQYFTLVSNRTTN